MKQNLHRPNTCFVEIHKMQVKYLYFIVHITGHLTLSCTGQICPKFRL